MYRGPIAAEPFVVELRIRIQGSLSGSGYLYRFLMRLDSGLNKDSDPDLVQTSKFGPKIFLKSAAMYKLFPPQNLQHCCVQYIMAALSVIQYWVSHNYCNIIIHSQGNWRPRL